MKRKDRLGLITLADVPALKGSKSAPKATIPIAKLGPLHRSQVWWVLDQPE